MPPKVIVIDGLIAAGKTQLLHTLKDELTARGVKVVCIFEPEWGEILSAFSDDPKRYGYHFQTKILHDRVVGERRAVEEQADVYILERSIYSDRLFMRMLHDMGHVTDMEMDDYTAQWKTWESLMPLKPNVFLWLNPKVETCMDRYVTRNRKGEKVTEEYQRELWKYHSRMYRDGSLRIGLSVVPMKALDWDFDFRDSDFGRKIATDEIQRIVNVSPPIRIGRPVITHRASF